MITKYLHCTIIHSEKKRNLDEIKKAIKIAERKNSKMYGIKVKPYKLILFDTLKDYWKKSRLDFGNACIMYNRIYMFEIKSKEKHFPLSFTLYHELNHLFYQRIVGHFKPEWLCEGVAIIDQKEYNIPKGWKKYFSSAKNPGKYLLSKTQNLKTVEERNRFFILSLFCTEHLKKKVGKKRLIRFIKNIPNPYNNTSFWRTFEEEFKMLKKQLIKNSLK